MKRRGTVYDHMRLISNKYKIFTQELDKFFFFIILMQTRDFSENVMYDDNKNVPSEMWFIMAVLFQDIGLNGR